jgi:hypothetical protein
MQVNKLLMDQRAAPAAGARELQLFHGTKSDSVDKINAQVLYLFVMRGG